MALRNYTNTATEATLVGAVTGSDINIGLAAFSGFPAAPFTAAIDRGTASEEVVLVTAISGSTVTCTRGYDGTTGKSHATGASFLHVTVAKDYDEANDHVNATAAHGTVSQVVGTTDTQTLSNKTLTAPVLSSATLTGTAAGASLTLSGTLTVTGAASFLGGITTPSSTVTSLTVSGTATVTTAAITTANVTTLAVSGSGTVGNDLTVNDDLTVLGDAAVTGPLTVTGKAQADHLVLAHQAVTPASPPASKGALWLAAGRVQLTESDGTGRRMNTHSLLSAWTGGTYYVGDTAEHNTTGEFRVYKGVSLGWRQIEPLTVADATARDALAAEHKYVGFRVKLTNNGWICEWDGTRWVKQVGGVPSLLGDVLFGAYSGFTTATGTYQGLFAQNLAGAHTAGTIRVVFHGVINWPSPGNPSGAQIKLAWANSQFGTYTDIPGAYVRIHSQSTQTALSPVTCDGYLQSDGTTKWFQALAATDVGGSSWRVLENDWHAWLL